MKTIIYFLIVIMIIGIVYSAIPNSKNQPLIFRHEVVLESQGKAISKNELSVSMELISKRLEDYGIRLFSIYPVFEKSQIRINFKKKQNIVEIAGLLCQKGELHFMETYSGAEVLRLVDKNDLLYSMMDVIEHEAYNAELGTCKLSESEKLSNYLNSNVFRKRIPANALFAWGKTSNENPNTLSIFSLKLSKEKITVLDGSVVSTIKLNSSNLDQPEIHIKFNAAGTRLWQNMTAENLNKSIAIVLDQQVHYAPIVKAEIKHGTCILTGKFSENELKAFVCIANNGKLPVAFSLK